MEAGLQERAQYLQRVVPCSPLCIRKVHYNTERTLLLGILFLLVNGLAIDQKGKTIDYRGALWFHFFAISQKMVNPTLIISEQKNAGEKKNWTIPGIPGTVNCRYLFFKRVHRLIYGTGTGTCAHTFYQPVQVQVLVQTCICTSIEYVYTCTCAHVNCKISIQYL